MWDFFNFFAKDDPKPVPQEYVFPVATPTPNPKPDSLWKRGMWVVQDSKVGILADFKNQAVIFHEVNVTTGETEKEYQVSIDTIRQAKYYEVPACRMSVSRDVARELGYGD